MYYGLDKQLLGSIPFAFALPGLVITTNGAGNASSFESQYSLKLSFYLLIKNDKWQMYASIWIVPNNVLTLKTNNIMQFKRVWTFKKQNQTFIILEAVDDILVPRNEELSIQFFYF